MNKGDIVNLVASRTGKKKKDVQEIVNCTVDILMDGILSGDRVHLLGFGTFYTSLRPKKVGRSMVTGKPVQIPPAMVVRFKAGTEMKRGLLDMQYEDEIESTCRSVFLS